MSSRGGRVGRILIPAFGGLYNDLIGRRSHLGVAAVIFDAAGRVLLVHHSYGRHAWDVPGGGRERHESLDQALRRELREEIGVELARADLRGIYYEPAVDQHHFVWRCEMAAGAEPKANPPEITGCGFFALDRLPRPINDFTIGRIADAQSSGPVAMTELGPRHWLD